MPTNMTVYPAEGILHMFIILEKERVCSLDEGFFDKT